MACKAATLGACYEGWPSTVILGSDTWAKVSSLTTCLHVTRPRVPLGSKHRADCSEEPRLCVFLNIQPFGPVA